MSAWIPSKPHIDAMLAEAVIRGVLGEDIVDRAGWELTHEVVASVAHRYQDDPTLDDLPGARPPWWIEHTGAERPVPDVPLKPYVHEPVGRRLTDAELLKAIGCYGYQACEHPEWGGSRACLLCEELKAKIGSEAVLDRLRATLAYDDAPWGFEAEDLA